MYTFEACSKTITAYSSLNYIPVFVEYVQKIERIKMRKLALSDKILLKVDKAARYIGGEVNSVMKDKNEIDIRFAMCFPDVYEIGMSNLGMMILYNMFNQREDVWCERLFSPWPDLDKVMREQNIPLFALESQEPIRDFDFLGITLGYEMCYTNILQVLDLSGIPLKSADRGEDFPIVIGGGACAYNPEPLAPFFDLFYIGEGETVYDALFDAYKANKKAGGSRRDFLLAAAKIPGIYVPSLYEVTYKEDGTIKSFQPKYENVPEKVEGIVKCMNPKCITNHEKVRTKFTVVKDSPIVLKCHYCEKLTDQEHMEMN